MPQIPCNHIIRPSRGRAFQKAIVIFIGSRTQRLAGLNPQRTTRDSPQQQFRPLPNGPKLITPQHIRILIQNRLSDASLNLTPQSLAYHLSLQSRRLQTRRQQHVGIEHHSHRT